MEPRHLLHSAFTRPSSAMHGASNRDIHLCPPHNNSSVYLTKHVRRTGRITNGMRSGRTTLQDTALSSPTPAPTPSEWPSQEQSGSGLTASALLSDVSAPACTNGVWLPLRPVSVASKNKPSISLSSNVQSTYGRPPHGLHGLTVLDDEISNGCSTLAPRSSAVW